MLIWEVRGITHYHRFPYRLYMFQWWMYLILIYFHIYIYSFFLSRAILCFLLYASLILWQLYPNFFAVCRIKFSIFIGDKVHFFYRLQELPKLIWPGPLECHSEMVSTATSTVRLACMPMEFVPFVSFLLNDSVLYLYCFLQTWTISKTNWEIILNYWNGRALHPP